MLRGEEVEDEEEVGVEHVIQSPDQIESMAHHPIAGHQTRHEKTMICIILGIVGSRLPEVDKVTELLDMKYQIKSNQIKSNH